MQTELEVAMKNMETRDLLFRLLGTGPCDDENLLLAELQRRGVRVVLVTDQEEGVYHIHPSSLGRFGNKALRLVEDLQPVM